MAGEFSNEIYRQMNEKWNVLTLTTAAEFSNGMVEKHNLILSKTFIRKKKKKKTLQDEKCKPKVAFVWAMSAKKKLITKFWWI